MLYTSQQCMENSLDCATNTIARSSVETMLAIQQNMHLRIVAWLTLISKIYTTYKKAAKNRSHIPTLRIFKINPYAELNHFEPNSNRQFKSALVEVWQPYKPIQEALGWLSAGLHRSRKWNSPEKRPQRCLAGLGGREGGGRGVHFWPTGKAKSNEL